MGYMITLREFMHCHDLADALIFLLKSYSDYAHFNVGSGVEVSIREFSQNIAGVVGYQAKALRKKVSKKPDLEFAWIVLGCAQFVGKRSVARGGQCFYLRELIPIR
jgi:nucleoside-diphosphate-sugar epimerase